MPLVQLAGNSNLLNVAGASSITPAPAQQSSSSSRAENDELVTIENLKKEKDFLKRRLERRYVKTSKVSERYVT